MYIEGIALENFSALPQTEINSSTKPCPRHEVFHSFLSDDSKNTPPLLPHTENV